MAMRHTWLLAGALTLAGLMVGPPAAASAVDGGTAATAVSPALSAAFTTGDEAARGGALRELLRIGSTEAVRLVVSRAPEQTPALRRAIEEGLGKLGERAVPALILERRLASGPPVRRFATTQLEAMEKSMPGEAIQAKSPAVLGEILRAYGLAKEMDALGVVLSFANADREVTREAARQALYDYGSNATGKLREAYATFHNRPAPDDWPPDRISRELFAAFDRDRRREMYVLHEEGLAHLAAVQTSATPDNTRLAKAVDAFDRILARTPDFERRREMVPAYVLFAKSIEEAEAERAMLLYQKAKQLDPASPRAPQIDSALLSLEARALRKRGVTDEDALRRAIALDPANTMAHAELQQIADRRGERASKLAQFGWAGAAICAGLALLLGLVALRRRFA